MKRRIWTVAATFSLAGVTFAPRVWAKGTVSVKEPTSDDDSNSDDSKDDAKEGAAAPSETASKAVDSTKSPNHGPRDKDNPQAKAAGDHVAMPPKMQGQGQATANEDHTVEHGDTLWDLSQKYLGNPWYWPKVWSYNPQIANPHWIYPGDQVKFYPGAAGDSEAPAQVRRGRSGGRADLRRQLHVLHDERPDVRAQRHAFVFQRLAVGNGVADQCFLLEDVGRDVVHVRRVHLLGASRHDGEAE